MNKEKLMKIAIHKSTWGFSSDWIEYCVRHNIEYKIVNCYSSDIIKQIDDCDVLLWHHHHMLAKDTLFAKQLLFSVNQAGKVVFPDFYTNWHFDDKVGQKYLLEAIKAPFAPTWVFYDKNEALEWLQRATFPMVFKLRGGSGSSNVRLVKTHSHAKKLVKKAFGRGFSPYNKVGDIKEQIRKFTWEKDRVVCFLKSLRRLVFSTLFARTIGYHKGYILFQKYYEKNKFDIRVIVIGERAFAIKRLVRKNDFRASGSGSIMYDKNEIDADTVFAIVSREIEDNVFDLVNALLENNKEKVFKVYYDLIEHNVKSTAIISVVSSKFLEILYTKSLMSIRYSKEDIAKFFGYSSGRVFYMMKNASEVSYDVLYENIKSLAELDYQIKSGKIDKDLGPELYFISK